MTRDGRVYELEAGSYPLGVRRESIAPVRRERLEAGDTVVLLPTGWSKAIAKATRSLRLRPASPRASAARRRRSPGAGQGVLADFEAFTRRSAARGRLTVLAARLPD